MYMKTVKIAMLALALAAVACGGPADKTAGPDGNAVLENIFNRKSVRSYTDQALSAAQIETLLRAAMAAPSGMNLQPWRFVVVTDPEVRQALAGPRGGMIAQAPAVFVVCGEPMMKGRPATEGGEPVLVPNGNWTADCAAATENLLLAAEALGLGAVWTACYPYDERMAQTRAALGLPDDVTPYCVVPVGYPAGDEQPKDKWKPENVHYDKW